MLGAIKYNLTHLLDFSGRDARQTFWYYVLVLVLLTFAVGMLITIPFMVASIGTAVEAAQAGASEQELQARIMGQMGGMLDSTLWVSLATNAAMALLLLSAFVRRLHDSGKPGWWAVVPLVAQAASTVVSIQMMGEMQAMMQHAVATAGDPAGLQSVMERQQKFASYGLIGWIGPLVVVGFGILKLTDGPNRYGTEPVRF